MARTLSGRALTGGLVVLLGVVLLLDTTGVAETESLWDWAPLVFVLLGLWALVRSGFRNLTGPVLVVAVAGTVQLRNLGVVSDEAIGTWWPLFVVLFGVLIVVNRSRRRKRQQVTGLDASGERTVVGIFGGGDHRFVTDTFTGLEAFVMFGGVDLDLRDVTVPSPPAVVEVLCLFGGVEVRVPDDWVVRIDALALFGGVDDTRPRGRAVTDGSARGPKPDLVVTGLVLFGGVEVRE